MSQIAILACVTLKEGMAGQYLAALEPLLVQALEGAPERSSTPLPPVRGRPQPQIGAQAR